MKFYWNKAKKSINSLLLLGSTGCRKVVVRTGLLALMASKANPVRKSEPSTWGYRHKGKL